MHRRDTRHLRMLRSISKTMNPYEADPSERSNADPSQQPNEKPWETARQKAEEGYAAGEQYVREHPGGSVLTVFGAGFILGLVVGWAIAREEDNSYSSRLSEMIKGLRRDLNFR